MPSASQNLLNASVGDCAMVRGTLAYSRLYEPLHGEALEKTRMYNRYAKDYPTYVVDVMDPEIMAQNPAGLTPLEAYVAEKIYQSKDGHRHLRLEPRAANKDYKVDVSELGPNERLYDRIPVCQPNAAGTGYDNVELVGNLANNLPVMVAVGCHTNKNGEKYMRPDMVVLSEGVRYWGSGNNGPIDLSAWGINLTNTVVATQPAAAPAQPQPQPMFEPAPQQAYVIEDHDIEFPPTPAEAMAQAAQPQVAAPQPVAVPPMAQQPSPSPQVVDIQQVFAEYGALVGRQQSRLPMSASDMARMAELEAVINQAQQTQAAPAAQVVPAAVPDALRATVGLGGPMVQP